MNISNKRFLILVSMAIAIALLAWGVWTKVRPTGLGEGFVSGNGRIEATEIDIATKYGGRVKDIAVREGDFVQAGEGPAQRALRGGARWVAAIQVRAGPASGVRCLQVAGILTRTQLRPGRTAALRRWIHRARKLRLRSLRPI